MERTVNNINELIKESYNLHILYVEDNKLSRESSIMIFEKFFKKIIVAVDGDDGYNKFKNNQVVIITDINMPKLNGLEMVGKIRAIDNDIPILILSACNESSYFVESIKLGVDGYLLKPIDMNQFTNSLRKVTKKIKLANDLKAALYISKQYQEVTDHSDIVSKTDLSGKITYANDEFCKISEYTREELIGKNHNIVRHPDNPFYIYQNMWETIKKKKQIWKGTIRNITKSGKIYYVASTVKPILDLNGDILEYIALRHNVSDIISQRKQLEDFLYYTHNPVLAIIEVIDYNNLEKFYGYSEISYIERQIHKKIFEYFPIDCGFKNIYILGNGKFAFVKDVEGLDIEQVIQEIKFILNNVNSSSFKIDETRHNLSIRGSLAHGSNVFENCIFGLQKLLKSKEEFILANDLAHVQYQEAQNNLNTLEMVNEAIEYSNIVSYFQPIVNNKSKEIVKYESLVRLIDKNDNVLSPYHFLDISKESRFYFQITKIVLKNSFEALYKTDKHISINLSALDIEHEIITRVIYELLDKHKEHSHRIVFELLEDESIEDMKIVTSFISKCKKYGVKIAIDDFGSGYSNFERLLAYQPDIIKIDGSLIKNILMDNYSLSVVKTIVAFAKAQNIEIIGEFVENEEIYNILNSLDVEYSQGYYFGKPAIL
ncbi:MAG: PAS domain S-box-containing protein [Sulfurimonas sp.]|jgi:PAS domain S-box-containing protein